MANLEKKALYFSADAKYLLNYSIYDIVNYAIARGYESFFIDEIHARADWTVDLKTLYDEGKARITFTGSSSMEVRKGADLSRRVVMRELKPASFREYLNIRRGAEIPALSLKSLYDKDIRKDLAVKYAEYGEFVQEYCRYGGVLYEGLREEFPLPIRNSLEKIIGTDMSYLREVDVKLQNDIYKLLYDIASSGPYEASYTRLAGYLSIGKATVIRIITDLEKLGLLRLVYPCGGGIRKEPKIYLSIPFRYALNEIVAKRTDVGVLREEFFANNVDVDCYFKTKRGEKTPDFGVSGKTIEVGGVRKRPQDADYIAVDGMNFEDNKIPLFLFGFLY